MLQVLQPVFCTIYVSDVAVLHLLRKLFVSEKILTIKQVPTTDKKKITVIEYIANIINSHNYEDMTHRFFFGTSGSDYIIIKCKITDDAHTSILKGYLLRTSSFLLIDLRHLNFILDEKLIIYCVVTVVEKFCGYLRTAIQ